MSCLAAVLSQNQTDLELARACEPNEVLVQQKAMEICSTDMTTAYRDLASTGIGNGPDRYKVAYATS